MGVGLWFLAAVMVVWVLKRWNEWWYIARKMSPERRRSLPPGSLGWPLIGNMPEFLWAYKSGNPDSFLDNYSKRYKRIGIYKAFMFGNPTIFLTTPETCKVCLMDSENFIPGWPDATNELIGKRSFLFITHDEHRRLRKLTQAPVSGHEALSMYLTFIEELAISALAKWSRLGEIEFLTELRKFTFKIIMHIFLSSAGDAVLEALEKVYSDLNYGMRAMAINVPGFAYHRALKARKVLVDVLKSFLKERRVLKEGNPQRKASDMMDALVDVQDENGRNLDDDEIIDIMIMYLNAGHESSGHITMWATVLLQEHQDCFEKAKLEQEEIRKSMPPIQKGLTLQEYRKMEYLSKVIDETLRIVNISFVAFRHSLSDVYINGYLIPKGWKVEMWYRTVHMDPEVYPNPKVFNPSRWDGVIPKVATFLPFGGGSRLCPGNELAKLEISIFLHYFLLRYKLVRSNPECPVRYLPHQRPTDNCKARIIKVYTEEI